MTTASGAEGPSATVDRLVALARSSGLDEQAAIRLAEAALDSGREADALAAVQAACRLHPTRAVLWQWLALLHRALDQHEPALQAFDRAARLKPDDARIAHGLAQTMLEAGQPAVPLFNHVLALAPPDTEILTGRAAALCAEGNAAQALEEMDTLLTHNPSWRAGHELAARLRYVHGDREHFTASLERALVARPGDASLWTALFILLVHAGRFEETLAATARARQHIGENIAVLVNEATALSELGRVAEADAAFTRIGSYEDVTIAVRYIRHLLRNGRIEEAASHAEADVRLPGGNIVWPYLSIAWRLLDDPRWAWLEGDPAFIGEYDLRGALPPLDALAAVLRHLHLSQHQPLDQSLRGGTQTDGNLFQRLDPEICKLRAAIVDAVAEHIGRLPPHDAGHPLLSQRRDRPARFSGSWSVRLAGAGHHAHHMHPAGWLSSAFYVAPPERQPTEDPDAGSLVFGVPQAELGIALPPIRTIRPKPGHLVLFPSTMWHGTLPFAAGERLTVAFDVLPPGS